MGTHGSSPKSAQHPQERPKAFGHQRRKHQRLYHPEDRQRIDAQQFLQQVSLEDPQPRGQDQARLKHAKDVFRRERKGRRM